MSKTRTAVTDSTRQTWRVCRLFRDAATDKRTGTLIVSSAEGATKRFLFREGFLVELDNGRDETVLCNAILATEAVTPRQLRKAEKSAEKSSCGLGEVLLGMNIVPEVELVESIQAQVIDEVSESLSWEVDSVELIEHGPSDRVAGFTSELSEHFELAADPEEVLLEAAQRLGRWDLLEHGSKILSDVFYATPGTFRYFQEPDTYVHETRVLGALDGTKDVEEVVRASGMDPFDGLGVIRSLVRNGDIELISPAQMFQLGNERAASGSLDNAYRLLRRAYERGLDEFDVQLRIAETLHRLDRSADAAEWYVRFSNQCLSQLRFDDAIDTLRQICDIAPDRLTAFEKLLEIYIQQGRDDEAVDIALRLAKRKETLGSPRDALDLLSFLLQSYPQQIRLHGRVIELAETCGENELAEAVQAALARELHARENTEQALETYQSLFCEGNDSLEVRLKLIHLHRSKGNSQKALEHINGLLSQGGKKRIKDGETLVFLHQSALELEPENIRSNRWLLKHHVKSGATERAVDLLKAWVDALEKSERHHDMLGPLEQLIHLEEKLEHRWAKAAVLEKTGHPEARRDVLLRISRLAVQKDAFDEAERALEAIVAQSPFDLEARAEQVELFVAMNRGKLAAKKLADLVTLDIIAGNVSDAGERCRHLQAFDPRVVDQLGALCAAKGDRKKALEQFIKAGKSHVRNRDFGMAKHSFENALEAQPGNAEAASLLASLDARPTTPAAPAPIAASRSPSAPLHLDRQPFQQTAAVKTTVTGITARLRGLKSGSPPETTARVVDEPVAERPDSQIGDAPTGASSSAARPTQPSQSGVTAGVGNAAARLRALGSGSSDESKAKTKNLAAVAQAVSPVASSTTTTAEPAASANSAASSGTVQPLGGTVKKELKGAAARLAALREKK